MALKDKNIPEGSEKTVPPDLGDAIRQNLQEGTLPCAIAFTIAKNHSLGPDSVGQAADALGIRFGRCQLGLFGYPGKQGWKESGVMAQNYPDDLNNAILQTVDANKRITCQQAWELARQFGVTRMHIGYIIDTMGFRIVACQLGAF